MKKTILTTALLFGIIAVASGCSNSVGSTDNSSGSSSSGSTSDTTESALTDSAVGNAATSGINEVNQASQLSQLGLSASSSAGLTVRDASGVRGCSDQDLTITFNCSDTDHTASVIRDFGAGCDVGDGVIITGKDYIGWTDMGSPACDSGTTKRPVFWTAVQGTPADAAVRIHSTDPDSPSAPVQPIVRSFSDGKFVKIIGDETTDYSGYQKAGETQSVNGSMTIPDTSRIKYKSDGTTKIFDHTISTPTALAFTLDHTTGQSPIRTVHSGELDVSHNLAKFTVHETYDEVVYDYNTCECAPVSGTITVAVTDNTTSEQVGTGTITFTESQTGTCGTEDMTYNGQAVTLPSLERCR